MIDLGFYIVYHDSFVIGHDTNGDIIYLRKITKTCISVHVSFI